MLECSNIDNLVYSRKKKKVLEFQLISDMFLGVLEKILKTGAAERKILIAELTFSEPR